jgi:hypothetical protein
MGLHIFGLLGGRFHWKVAATFEATLLKGKVMSPSLFVRNLAVAVAAALITAFGAQPYDFASRLASLLA